MSTGRRIRWDHVSTVVSATVLVGVEFLGAGLALGWAIAALFDAGIMWEIIFEGAFAVLAVYAIYRFYTKAKGVEPFVEG
jgi:membrane protein implicated in regulation of membrane protease activity